MKRRDFLKFVGMASSAAVLTSCGAEKGTEKIIPFLIPPEEEDYLPGEAMYRYSACTECPAGCGVEVKIVDFNPRKLEGTKGHPINDGALCLRGQASLMRLYHPQRLKSPLKRNPDGSLTPITWEEAYQLILDKMREAQGQGRRNVWLSGMTGGSLSALIDEFSRKTGVERLPEYELYSQANLREAYKSVFGRDEIPAYAIEKADFLLTFGADIIETFMNPVESGVQLQKAREQNELKWVHLEPHASLTGFKADERKILQPGSEAYVLAFLLNFILTSKVAKNPLPSAVAGRLPSVTEAEAAEKSGLSTEELTHLAESFLGSASPLLIVGGVSTAQPNGAAVALFAALIQWTLGMTDATVDFSRSRDYRRVGTLRDMKRLADRLNNGEIGVMFIANTDPVGTAPTGIGLKESLAQAAFRVALTDFANTPTAEACDLLLPLSHSLESWGDVTPRKGVTTVLQPVIEKLYDSRSEGEFLLELMQKATGQAMGQNYEEYLRRRWSQTFGAANVDQVIQTGYHEAPVSRTAVTLSAGQVARALSRLALDAGLSGNVLYALPSLRSYDGRSNVLKLTREVPDPLTSISYGSWVSVSQESARELGLPEKPLVRKDREQVRIGQGNHMMTLPTFIQPGLQKGVFTMYRDQVDPALLGYDEQTGEPLATIGGVEVVNDGTTRPLAILAGSYEQGHRNIVRETLRHHIPWLEGDETLYPKVKYPQYRWGMTIDLESCIGCSACVAACHIENNIPCVGEKEHLLGREMSWIRIEPFYFEDGTMDTLVMLCQQCGAAPCENVCPVYATYHNDEGLNVMVYNRCVGTRYCHNNCPYKVRRFNWFDWTDEGAWAEPLTRMLNPEIWARPKGVMEKCTFCVQRIRKAKDRAKDEGRTVRDGEVVPACAQTCPTNAITFGNLLDPESAVVKKSQSDRSFRVLEDMGTRPAVHYLRKEETA